MSPADLENREQTIEKRQKILFNLLNTKLQTRFPSFLRYTQDNKREQKINSIL